MDCFCHWKWPHSLLIFQHTFKSKDWRSIFTTPESMRQHLHYFIKQHNSRKGGTVSLRPPQCLQTPGTGRFFFYLRYERMLSWSQAPTLKDKIFRAKEIHKIKKRLLHKIQFMLDMSWWRYAFYPSLSMNNVSVSTDSIRLIPNAVSC